MRWTSPAKRKGDVALAIHSQFEFIDWGTPGIRDVDLNLTAKEITESGASMGETLAIQKIQPSGTLAYPLERRSIAVGCLP